MNKVNGNITAIRGAVLARIEALYDMPLGRDTFASRELLEELAACTALTNREISVYIKRDGVIADVRVGDSGSVSMVGMRVVRNAHRLCGVRCVHTHPDGGARLSDVDIGTLKTMKLDGMAAVGVRAGKPIALCAGFVGEWDEENGYGALLFGPFRIDRLPQRALMRAIYEADDRLRRIASSVAARPERAILVGIESAAAYDSMAELAALAGSAGAQVVGQSVQKRRAADTATYIGHGKTEDLRLMACALEADVLIVDDELSAVQLRNLETALSRPVIDRTMLILDIFAARAQSREGRLQVELAQLRYRLPRLLGAGLTLSRQGAGIGTRGPGEKKLEIDRRRIRGRIHELEEDLNEIVRQRGVRRWRREKNAVPLVALAGYTNAGKSTLLNAVSGAGVYAADMLFATLDPVVRQVTLPNGTQALFSDTVGFINKLPHELVRAFRSTLEEVARADIILHVIDSANPAFDAQMRVVEEALLELGAIDTPRINVFNKIDNPAAAPARRGEHAFVSAKTGTGIEALLTQIENKLNAGQALREFIVPYESYDALAHIRGAGRVLSEEHLEDGVHVAALVDDAALWRIKNIKKAAPPPS
ncbi:MAG: GTPase HflX [Clostridiales bacterium]|jgi:GTP-binding protein HflX|nr:GTPase HflX [Clostridiales bacterium]